MNMIKKHMLVMVMVVSMFTGLAQGASDYDRLKPWLEDETIAVLSIDINNINTQTVFDQIAKIAVADGQLDQNMKAEMDQTKILIDGYINQFRTEGVQFVYLLANMYDLPSFYIVVTHEPGKACPSVAGVIQLLNAVVVNGMPFIKLDTVKDENDVLFAGSATTLQRLQAATRPERPDIASALKADDSYGVKLILAPTVSLHRVIAETIEPVDLCGEMFTGADINSSVQWAAIGLNLDKQLQITYTLKSADGQAASRAAVLVGKFFECCLKDEIIGNDIRPLFDALQPVVTQDKLQCSLNHEQINNMLIPILNTMAQSDKLQADSYVSMKKVKSILLACIIYCDKNGNKMPDALNDLLVAGELKAEDIASPLPGSGYIYRGNDLTTKVKNPAAMIAIYERFEINGQASFTIGFMDGHVERRAQAAFTEALAKDNALRKEQNLTEKPDETVK